MLYAEKREACIIENLGIDLGMRLICKVVYFMMLLFA